MIYLYLVGELILLFILSQTLSKTLSQVFYTIFRSEKITVYLLAILFFPGVVIHEVSHWLMAQILFVPTGKVEFMPQLRGKELKLGSVAVATSDPFRRALIGFAPFLVGTSLILTVLFFYDVLSIIPEAIKPYLVGYFIFEIGNTMFSSKKDLEGTVELVLTFAILAVIVYFLGFRIPAEWIGFFLSDQMTSIAEKAILFIAIPLVLNFVVIFLCRVILRLFK